MLMEDKKMSYLTMIMTHPQTKRVMDKLMKTKLGNDDMVMKVGFIAVALSIFTLWKTGVLQLVSDWISGMQTQSANFWT